MQTRNEPVENRIDRHALALRSLAESTRTLESGAPLEAIGSACSRGYFRPTEEQLLFRWFGHFLTLRDALWEVIAELSASLGADSVAGSLRLHLDEEPADANRRSFFLGYAAACLVVRLDRLLVEEIATQSLTQRKLNEGATEFRIPRKQFTAVFESLSQPRNALQMRSAMHLAERGRAWMRGLGQDPMLEPLVSQLDWLEAPLDASLARYLRQLRDYGEHAIRRLAASSAQQATFSALESSGRMVGELRDHWSEKRLGATTLKRLREILKPGDVFATRHDVAMSNLFLPGYWPHAALYVGNPEERTRLGIEPDAAMAVHWSADRCVLEALKDGVRFRPLEETLSVDALAVVRPRISARQIGESIERAALHQGKMYNFDFDFFRSDRLVCTEVVYQAFDGAIDIELKERAGRPSLAAEDILDLAFDSDDFEVVAIFGAKGCEDQLVVGPEARRILEASYRSP